MHVLVHQCLYLHCMHVFTLLCMCPNTIYQYSVVTVVWSP